MIKAYDKVVYKRMDEIRPYENNARENSKAVAALVKAIPVMGFNVPLVLDKDGVIVKGHSRYEALKQLGVEMAPCIVIDGDPEAIAEERLLDNKLSELATYDEDKLKYELRELSIDLSKFDIQVPQFGNGFQGVPEVTEAQVKRTEEQLTGAERQVASEKKSLVEIHCPNCGEDFFADLQEVMKYAV